MKIIIKTKSVIREYKIDEVHLCKSETEISVYLSYKNKYVEKYCFNLNEVDIAQNLFNAISKKFCAIDVYPDSGKDYFNPNRE